MVFLEQLTLLAAPYRDESGAQLPPAAAAAVKPLDERRGGGSTDFGAVQQIQEEEPVIDGLLVAEAAASLEMASQASGNRGGGANNSATFTAATIIGAAIGSAFGVLAIGTLSAAAVRQHLRRSRGESVRSGSSTTSSLGGGRRRSSIVKPPAAVRGPGQVVGEPGAGLTVVATRAAINGGTSVSKVSCSRGRAGHMNQGR